MTRIAALSDVHGNVAALEAVIADIGREKPDRVVVAGDLVLNGPEPVATVDMLRNLAADGAAIISGNTDIAVADFDYAAAFPWMTDGVPDAIVAAAEWANEALGEERVEWLRGLPAERRLRSDDDTLVIVILGAGLDTFVQRRPGLASRLLVFDCHGSPGSQTSGFDQNLDPSVTIERVARTDARVIVCGHTHLPEVRDLGWKVIVNDGSAGYVFDGDPSASWALIDIADYVFSERFWPRIHERIADEPDDLEPRLIPGDLHAAADRIPAEPCAAAPPATHSGVRSES